MQEYRNNTNSALEVKYVFPLDSMAVVCGFEAFINDKHVVGKTKALSFVPFRCCGSISVKTLNETQAILLASVIYF